MFKDKTSLITGGTGSFGNAVMKRFLDTDIKEKIRSYENDHALFSKIKHGFNGNKPTSELKIKVGPLVSVPYVVQNEDKFLSFKDNQRKLIGLEMESYGIFYSACNTINPKPIPIVIKSFPFNLLSISLLLLYH